MVGGLGYERVFARDIVVLQEKQGGCIGPCNEADAGSKAMGEKLGGIMRIKICPKESLWDVENFISEVNKLARKEVVELEIGHDEGKKVFFLRSV